MTNKSAQLIQEVRESLERYHYINPHEWAWAMRQLAEAEVQVGHLEGNYETCRGANSLLSHENDEMETREKRLRAAVEEVEREAIAEASHTRQPFQAKMLSIAERLRKALEG